MVDHLLEPALAHREQLGERPEIVLGCVDGEPLHRFVPLSVDLLGDDLGLADGQLEAFAAHQLDQDRQCQLPATLDLPGVGAFGRQHADGDVADQFGIQPVAQQPRGQLRPGLARERRGVDTDGHADRRLVHGDHRQRPRVLRIGQRLTDHDIRDARDGDDVARSGLLARHPLQRLRDQQLADLHPVGAAVRPAQHHALPTAKRPVVHPAQRETAEVGGGVEVGDQRLQGRLRVIGRHRDRLKQHVEQRLEVGRVGVVAVLRPVQRGPPRLGVAVDDREVDLGFVRVQVEEELVGRVDDLGDPGVGAVHLVDDQNDRLSGFQRLTQDEPGLRQRTLARVDQQHDTVDHGQTALDLPAEVRVAGGVNDVDRDVAVLNRGVLRENRDALLAFKIHRVHDTIRGLGMVTKGAGLPQHRVDEGCLAMVDVGNDRDVTQVGADGHGGGLRYGRGAAAPGLVLLDRWC